VVMELLFALLVLLLTGHQVLCIAVHGESYPYCVEVAGVWPLPNSVIKPIYQKKTEQSSKTKQYIFRVKFSRPVMVQLKDTTGGYQPEIYSRLQQNGRISHGRLKIALEKLNFNSRNVPPVFLTTSQSSVIRYYAYRLHNWHGSDDEYIAYFRLPILNKARSLLANAK